MKKIFEIPIYALSRESLESRVVAYIQKLKRDYMPIKPSDGSWEKAIDQTTFPKRIWDYNHIIGFIVLENDEQDVALRVYLTHNSKERYIWKSSVKKWLYDIRLNGAHFPIPSRLSNGIIRKEVEDLVVGTANEFIPKRYYIDMESFKRINDVIDYETLLKR